MKDIALLKLLSHTFSVSGFEYHAEETLRTRVAPLFDDYRTDALGNHLFFRYGGRSDAKTLLLDAHFDEIGMMVTKVEANGFLRITNIGGLDRRCLQATDVRIYGKEVCFGVITSTPPHLQGDANELCTMNDLRIDTGLSEKALAEKGIGIGTPVGFAQEVGDLGEDRLCGRSFDNKSCVFCALSAALEAALPEDWNLAVSLSSREESSGIGARSAAYALSPDCAIVLDVNFGKVHTTKSHETMAMGKGPALSLSAVTDRVLTEAILECAKEHRIPHQSIVEAMHTGTNADLLALAGQGVPCCVVSLPLRHMHTPTEVISVSDMEALVELLCNFIQGGLTKWYLETQNF